MQNLSNSDRFRRFSAAMIFFLLAATLGSREALACSGPTYQTAVHQATGASCMAAQSNLNLPLTMDADTFCSNLGMNICNHVLHYTNTCSVSGSQFLSAGYYTFTCKACGGPGNPCT